MNSITSRLIDSANNKKGIRSGIMIGSLASGKIMHCLGCIQSGPYLLGHSSSLKALKSGPKDMGHPVNHQGVAKLPKVKIMYITKAWTSGLPGHEAS